MDPDTPCCPLTAADVAIHRSQGARRAFSDEPHSTASETEELGAILRDALAGGQLSLFYQPKLDVRANGFFMAEALLRCHLPAAANLTTGELIIAAERCDFNADLALWVMRQALSDQSVLMEHEIELRTSVNLPGNLLSDSEFTLRAVDILKSANGRIGIEITETSVIEEPRHALANLQLYQAAGAAIAIDDYGIGLSSLRYLKQIPADELKIDREFIKDFTNSNRDPMIVRSTIDLAHALGMKITAEGVDCSTKLALLKVMGCDYLQGFHIARPMPLSDLIAFLADAESEISRLNTKPSLLLGVGTNTA